MTAGAAVLSRLEAAGLQLRAEGQNLVAGPRSALTDELLGLIRGHKLELLDLLRPAKSEPVEMGPAPLAGHDCMGCGRLTMTVEQHPGTRKIYYWRCREGFELLMGRNLGERVVLAPPECDKFVAWACGAT